MSIVIPTKVWDPNGTYTIQEIADQHIKPQQQINLSNFKAYGTPSQGLFEITPEEYHRVIVVGWYNRAVEHFYYKTLYNNLTRRGGFNYASASGIIAFLRPDGTIVIVAGVHRCVFSLIKGISIHVELHKHEDGLSQTQMEKIEAEVYTDEGYHLSKQTPEQALKAAFVAEEKWATDFSSTLSRMGMKVKSLGLQDESAVKLHGHKAIIDTLEKYSESAVIEASEYINEEFSDEGKVDANFLAGLSILIYKSAELGNISLEDKTLTKCVSTANTLMDGFIANLGHGVAKETLALRFAHLYNQVGSKKKKFISLDLLKMASLLKVKPSQLQFDSFMAGNGLGINN